MSINYVQMHIGDLLLDTMDLCPAAMGSYIRLIMAHYKNGLKGIPADHEKLKRLSGCDTRVWTRIKDDVLAKFDENDGWLTHERVIEEIKKIERKAGKKETSGELCNTSGTYLDTSCVTEVTKTPPVKSLKNNKTAERQTNNQEPITNIEKDKDKSLSKKASRFLNFMEREYGSTEIPHEWGQWAYEDLRLTEEQINFEWEKFRDYWIGVGGQKGCKLDWLATWRNWCRKKFEEVKRKEELNGLYSRK